MGADASHAWAAVWLGDDEWLAFDPTNDQWQNDRYVTVAWGRDYGDVPPVKGVIFTEAQALQARRLGRRRAALSLRIVRRWEEFSRFGGQIRLRLTRLVP